MKVKAPGTGSHGGFHGPRTEVLGRALVPSSCGSTPRRSIPHHSGRAGRRMTNPTAIDAERIARVLDKGRRSGDSWVACCPAHDDAIPSLSVTDNPDGGAPLVHCHAGCSQDAVLGELKARGLWTCGVDAELCRYEYRRVDGTLHLSVCMYRDRLTEKKTDKRPWREPRGVKGPHPLYRLPELRAADPARTVLVVEGEHTCDVARSAWPGEPVVTWAGGCKSWRQTDWTPLRGRTVKICADADDQGRGAARAIAAHLHDMGAAVSLALPDGETGDDVADWLREGRDTACARLRAHKQPFERAAAPEIGQPNDTSDDKHIALYLAQEWADDMAHTCGLGWFVRGTGGLWKCDPNGVEARKRIRRVLTGSDIAKPSVKTRDVARELADELNVDPDEWNGGDVLGLPDGRVVDLSTGEVRAVFRDERVHQRLAVVPEPGEPSEWLRVLDETFAELAQPDMVTKYVRWWFRYSLGVSCHDESILFLQGPSGSGKSTICDVWTYIAGDYAATREGKRLAGHANQHTQWLAGLHGKRLVRVGELPDGGRWDTGPINALASGEIIEANRMRQDSIEFQSVSKLLITSNHKPSANSQSGLFRRLRVVECRHVANPPDEGLKARLRLEAGRILRWVFDAGERPDVPVDIRNAGAAYRAESDALGEWLDARAIIDPNKFTPSADLWKHYRRWCDTMLTDPLRKSRFEMLLTEKFGKSHPKRVNGHVVKCRIGIKVRSE